MYKRKFSGNSRGRFGRFSHQKKRRVSVFRDVSKFINRSKPENVEVYVNKNSFNDFALDSRLKENISTYGYKQPSPIQDQAINHILIGKDVVGIANTGTGKTAAFILPLINKVINNRNEKIIVVAPTRELAIQINQEMMRFSFKLNVYSVCAVGGMPISRQISDLKRSHNFVMGTPGRIKDLIERGHIKMNNFKTIVLDEADRMLDMGFVNDMRFLMSAMPQERQTLFFSATLSNEIEKIIKDFLKDPISISVKKRDTANAIDQDVVYTKISEKFNTLHKLLTNPEFSKVLVFGKTKHGVERLSSDLSAKGIKSESIHGNKNHNQRQRALKSFKDNYVNVLIATDVAARGLDIPDITHVINYDLPSTYEDYIHRIGRTGRSGKKGKALTFIE